MEKHLLNSPYRSTGSLQHRDLITRLYTVSSPPHHTPHYLRTIYRSFFYLVHHIYPLRKEITVYTKKKKHNLNRHLMCVYGHTTLNAPDLV